MMDGNAQMGPQVREQAVGTTIQVITCDYFAAWLQQTSDDIQRGHAGGYGESMLSGRNFGDMMLYGAEC